MSLSPGAHVRLASRGLSENRLAALRRASLAALVMPIIQCGIGVGKAYGASLYLLKSPRQARA
jgi:hypothetical protein